MIESRAALADPVDVAGDPSSRPPCRSCSSVLRPGVRRSWPGSPRRRAARGGALLGGRAAPPAGRIARAARPLRRWHTRAVPRRDLLGTTTTEWTRSCRSRAGRAAAGGRRGAVVTPLVLAGRSRRHGGAPRAAARLRRTARLGACSSSAASARSSPRRSRAPRARISAACAVIGAGLGPPLSLRSW